MSERSETERQTDRRRVATVDVGTNSIRLLVAEARPDGTYRLLDDEKVVTRLGRGMSHSDRLDEEAMRDSARAIAHMKQIAEGYDVELLRAVATCAVREAVNGDVFRTMVREQAGLDIEIISGEEEGRLALLSVRAAFDIRSRDVAVLDIGGGSTELILSTGGVVQQIGSLPIGAVRLTEAVERADSPSGERLKAMRKIIRKALKGAIRRPAAPPQLMIGTGGTFTTLAVMDLLRRRRTSADDAGASGVRGHEVLRSDLRRLLETLNAMSRRERQDVPGLNPDRADIIVAGLVIAETIMKRLGINTLCVHDRGIRDGLLLSMTHELFPDAATHAAEPPDRLRSVRRFAQRCNYEKLHSERVTELALQIHDQLANALPNPPAALREPECRELLQCAGILHDVGYYINYSRHHKHSYHLIVHSDLPGFSHHELKMIANVARYHRRAHPKTKHEPFMQLPSADRERVRVLAAILRVADGLDRAHAGNVRSVRIKLRGGAIDFLAESERHPDVDLWGAARKSRLFFKVFGLEPNFRRAGHAAAEPALFEAAGRENERDDDAADGKPINPHGPLETVNLTRDE